MSSVMMRTTFGLVDGEVGTLCATRAPPHPKTNITTDVSRRNRMKHSCPRSLSLSRLRSDRLASSWIGLLVDGVGVERPMRGRDGASKATDAAFCVCTE